MGSFFVIVVLCLIDHPTLFDGGIQATLLEELEE